jgi:hypothetical protein
MRLAVVQGLETVYTHIVKSPFLRKFWKFCHVTDNVLCHFETEYVISSSCHVYAGVVVSAHETSTLYWRNHYQHRTK